MVIDDKISLRNVDIVIQNGRYAPVQKTEAATEVKEKTIPQDRVTFSSKALEIARIKKAVEQVPDVRDGKVNDLKESVSKGTYNVSGELIAEKMLKESVIDTVV